MLIGHFQSIKELIFIQSTVGALLQENRACTLATAIYIYILLTRYTSVTDIAKTELIIAQTTGLIYIYTAYSADLTASADHDVMGAYY